MLFHLLSVRNYQVFLAKPIHPNGVNMAVIWQGSFRKGDPKTWSDQSHIERGILQRHRARGSVPLKLADLEIFKKLLGLVWVTFCSAAMFVGVMKMNDAVREGCNWLIEVL